MTNSTNEPSPTENPLLNKLKEKWEAGDFAIDKDSVYGVDEAIEDAGKRLITPVDIMPDSDMESSGPIDEFAPFPLPNFGSASDNRFNHIEPDVWYNIDAREFKVELSKDPLPHHKTCRFCERSSRNEHCEECYEMIRSAATNATSDRILAKGDLHPCLICEEGEIMTTICANCMNALLE